MRNLALGVTFALWISAGVVEAADVEFECGETLFEPSATNDDAFCRFTSVTNDEEEFRRRFVINPSPNFPTYDSPLYDGLWPMTISAFRSHDDKDNQIEMEFEFPEPQKADAFLLASNEDRTLRGSMWNVTREKFAAADNEVIFGKFTR